MERDQPVSHFPLPPLALAGFFPLDAPADPSPDPVSCATAGAFRGLPICGGFSAVSPSLTTNAPTSTPRARARAWTVAHEGSRTPCSSLAMPKRFIPAHWANSACDSPACSRKLFRRLAKPCSLIPHPPHRRLTHIGL